MAAEAATTTIPIALTFGGDPVLAGHVASLNRLGGNVTGVSWFGTLLSGKTLGLLHELVPNAAVIALLANPKSPESARAVSDALEAARTLGLQLVVLNASTPPRRMSPCSIPRAWLATSVACRAIGMRREFVSGLSSSG